MSSLLDLLDEDLVTPAVRIQVQQVFEFAKGDPAAAQRPVGRTKSLGPAKSLTEFYDLVRQAVNDYERRAGIVSVNKVIFTEEEPDINSQTESIVFSLIKKAPGQFGQGPPFGAEVVNLRPILREEVADPENPGYRSAITGYFYDNIVRFTCWARTNKAANKRAEWFEDLMEEYTWWYKLQGVDRVIFFGRDADIVVGLDDNKWYGRPIDFFVRTEKIRVFNEKTIESILIKLKVTNE